MKYGGLFTLLLLMAGSAYAQQEALIFQPPVPHDMQRYEAGWNKNPFTLKTVPPVVESISFAVDLAIGTYYGDAEDPTIIIVNTKTNERISLKQNQPAANGMKLSNVRLGSSRKDVVASVTLRTETADIRYNDDYVKQIAAAEMTKVPATQQQTRTQQKIPPPQTSSQPFNGTSASPPPVTSQTSLPPPVPTRSVTSTTTRNAGNQSPAFGTPQEAAPLVSQAANVKGDPPVAARQRLVIPTRNAAAISQ